MEPATIAPTNSDEPVDSYQRILTVAEALYMKHGFRAVSLRDLANALSMRQASLYYHFPDGKEQIFEAVVNRALLRHKAGIEQAIANNDGDLRQQLLSVIDWFTSQPPMNLTAMVHADMPALQTERMHAVEQSVNAALFMPLFTMLTAAMQRGEIRPVNPGIMTGLLLSIISGLDYGATQMEEAQRPAMYAELVDILLQGIYPR